MKIIILTSLLLATPLAYAQKSVALFDGKTLKGWTPVNSNKAKYWSVINGVITASNGNKKMPTNTYLATTKQYQNFEFKCKFRLSGNHKTGLINSGIQYRSLMHKTKKPGVHKIIGYQADIGKGYWGDIYDEHRRGKLIKGDTTELFKNFKEDGWNTYTIRCNGSRHELFINGHQTVNYSEPNSNIETYGVIALQLHSGGVAKMEYKDISITEYPASKMALPLVVSAKEGKIRGSRLKLRGDKIVGWNKTNDFIEWKIPSNIEPGKYNVVINYASDKRRQGSSMVFSTDSQQINFKTTSNNNKWAYAPHNIGEITLKQEDKKFTLKAKIIRKQWAMDFKDITFKPVK